MTTILDPERTRAAIAAIDLSWMDEPHIPPQIVLEVPRRQRLQAWGQDVDYWLELALIAKERAEKVRWEEEGY